MIPGTKHYLSAVATNYGSNPITIMNANISYGVKIQQTNNGWTYVSNDNHNFFESVFTNMFYHHNIIEPNQTTLILHELNRSILNTKQNNKLPNLVRIPAVHILPGESEILYLDLQHNKILFNDVKYKMETEPPCEVPNTTPGMLEIRTIFKGYFCTSKLGEALYERYYYGSNPEIKFNFLGYNGNNKHHKVQIRINNLQVSDLQMSFVKFLTEKYLEKSAKKPIRSDKLTHKSESHIKSGSESLPK